MLQDPLSKPRPPDHTAAAAGGGGGGGGAAVQASDRKHINGSDGLARNSGRASAAGLQGGAAGGGGGAIIIKCPRCDSMNTKFCYYNNYSLTQPRHFCKNCRRYWTQGGSLRNVPVGGGCRKNKRLAKPIITSSSSAAAAMAPPPPPSSACNYSRLMALDPPGLLMDMNHLDMATNPNPHHRHRHPHPQHHHQSGHGHPYGAANLMMMMMPAGGEASSPFPMDAMIDPQQLAHHHHSLSMNHHPPPVVAGDGSHLLSMAFSRLQESLRLNGGGGGEHMIASQEAEHKNNQCGQQLSLMTTMNPNPNPNPNLNPNPNPNLNLNPNPNPNFNPNPNPNPNFNPNPNLNLNPNPSPNFNPNPNHNLNPNPNPNLNPGPNPNINNACLNMIPTPPFEHDSRSPVNAFSHHHHQHHHQNNAASMKSESAGNHSSVFTPSVNGSSTGRLASMEDQLPASFSHASHLNSADSNGPLSPAMDLSASNNAAHFDLEARLKLQQQRQLALHLGAGAGAGAGDAYHHHNHRHSHSHHHQSFNIMQDDHHTNQNINAANAINVITANNNHHNQNNSSSSNLSVFDDPSDRSETLNMLRRHIQHANNCSQDEGSNNVDSSNKLVLASHGDGDGDGYGGDHAHDAGMNSASANHELTTNHHHYVAADHHQQQLISFWNHSNGGSINPTIWNK